MKASSKLSHLKLSHDASKVKDAKITLLKHTLLISYDIDFTFNDALFFNVSWGNDIIFPYLIFISSRNEEALPIKRPSRVKTIGQHLNGNPYALQTYMHL